MQARPMTHRCGTCGQEWWDAHVCPKQPLKDGRTLDEWVTATKIVSDGTLVDDGWPRLTKPARVGNGRFGVGVSSRLVIEAAQRQHEYAEEEGRLTDEQARQHERNRRKLWDMVNGPLCDRMSCGEPCNLRPPCPDCGRACHDVPEGA